MRRRRPFGDMMSAPCIAEAMGSAGASHRLPLEADYASDIGDEWPTGGAANTADRRSSFEAWPAACGRRRDDCRRDVAEHPYAGFGSSAADAGGASCSASWRPTCRRHRRHLRRRRFRPRGWRGGAPAAAIGVGGSSWQEICSCGERSRRRPPRGHRPLRFSASGSAR